MTKKYDSNIEITHLDGSTYKFSKASYTHICVTGIPDKMIINTEHCGEFEFYVDDLMKVKIDDTVVFNVSDEDSFPVYLTADVLKEVLEHVPDDAKVYYERIEDVYFEENGWKNEWLMDDEWFDRANPDSKGENWINAFGIFYNKEENALKITAHY